MRKTIGCILFIALTLSAIAQQDPKAQKILDKLSEQMSGYKSIVAKFDYTLENRIENVSETQKGNIYIKGDKYKLILKNAEIFFDGKNMTTFVPRNNEATITQPDLSDPTTINPAEIFTIYKKDFKYRFISENNENGRAIYEIDLYPMKPKGKSYSRIKMKIDKAKMQIVWVKQFGKDKINFIIDIKEIKTNLDIPDILFQFNKKAHPDVDVIDMRE